MKQQMITRNNKQHAGIPTGAYAGQRIHLIGAGGSGMRALAQMLIDRGAVVSGSDSADSAAMESLKAAGAATFIGQQAENLPAFHLEIQMVQGPAGPLSPESQQIILRQIMSLKGEHHRLRNSYAPRVMRFNSRCI